MSDLTDDMLSAYASYEDCDRPLSDTELVQLAMAKELQRHRAAQFASTERVRSVVRTAAMVEVCAAVSRLMGPTYWYDNPSAHGMWERTADAIASHVAEQLAVPAVGLSAEGRKHLTSIRNQLVYAESHWRAEIATLDRLLGAKP
jgi:hypothetical protein